MGRTETVRSVGDPDSLHLSVTGFLCTEGTTIPCDNDRTGEQRMFISSLLERENALQSNLR